MRSKDYIINVKPIRWARVGYSKNHFFDTQKQDKLAYGLYILNGHGDSPPFAGPLSLDVTFYMQIPKLKSKRAKSIYHHFTPDADNLTKFLMDSITQVGTIWEDDKQVSILIAKKIYDPKPRVEFTIRELA